MSLLQNTGMFVDLVSQGIQTQALPVHTVAQFGNHAGVLWYPIALCYIEPIAGLLLSMQLHT